MRELKFRATLPATPSYAPPMYYLEYPSRLDGVNWWDEFDGKPRNVKSIVHQEFLDTLIIMQFTGVKDRDGTDIYEDDILELYDGSRYRVIYNSEWGGYALEGLFDRETLGDKVQDWDAKVVGNIHENKDLL